MRSYLLRLPMREGEGGVMKKRWNLNYMPHEFNEVKEYIEQMSDLPAPLNNALAFSATLY